MIPRPSVLWMACAALLLGGCGGKSDERPEAIILHTGRLIGNVYPPGVSAAAPLQHYPYLAGYVKRVRAEAALSGTPVFLIDLGDSLEGSFASYATEGKNMVEFFNALDYDAVCLGNLDGRVRAEVIRELRAMTLCPFVDDEGNPAMPGTQIVSTITKGGVTLTLAANFYGDTPPAQYPLRFPAEFGPENKHVEPVRDYQAALRNVDTTKGLQVLSWMKFEDAPDARYGKFMQALSAAGFDLILAHRIYGSDTVEAWKDTFQLDSKPPVSVNILRSNSGFTVARVDLRRSGTRWRVLRHSVEPMTANAAPPDPEVSRRIERLAGQIAKADAVVANLGRRWQEREILELYLAALAREGNADAVAYSREAIRSGWGKGALRLSHIFNSLPWTNRIVSLEIPQARLRDLHALGGLQVLRRETLPDPVTLVTSRYFADLIQRQSGEAGVRVREAGKRLEFEYFADFLRSQDDLETARETPGWVHESN